MSAAEKQKEKFAVEQDLRDLRHRKVVVEEKEK
jgi:hypothetical protein